MEKSMKKYIAAALLCLPLAGCFGNSATDNTLIGQIKKVKRVTPIFCNNRVDVDVSLGIMRNGVGSMSTQDIWLSVPDGDMVTAMEANAATGAPVKITYDTPRVAWCWQDEWATAVEPVK
jgi:hypothetical protein